MKLRKNIARATRRNKAYENGIEYRRKRGVTSPEMGYHRPGSMNRKKTAPAGTKKH